MDRLKLSAELSCAWFPRLGFAPRAKYAHGTNGKRHKGSPIGRALSSGGKHDTVRRRKRCPWIFKLPYYPTHPENVSSSQWHGGHPSCEPAESLSPTRSFSDSQPLNSTPKPVVTPMAVLDRSAVPPPTPHATSPFPRPLGPA